MSFAIARRNGLAMYPADPCFDPDRPSWLPYWLDTWNEGACKYGGGTMQYPKPPADVVPLPAPPIDDDPGSPTYGQPLDPATGEVITTPEQAEALIDWLAGIQDEAQKAEVMRQMKLNAATRCAAQTVDCAGRMFSPYLKVSDDCTGCVFDFTSHAAILTGIALIATLFVLKKVL